MGIVGVIAGIKKIHPKDLALVSIGKFFYAYGKDAYVLSYIFGYKLMKIGKPGETDHIIREPDLLYSDENYCDTLGYGSIEEMAEDFVKKYKEMSDSIKKYKGFFIGRYELTGDIESPTEKKGEVLSCEKINGNWYDLYNICQNVVTGKEKVKSTMIYGVQWDATMDWLKETKFKDNPSKVDSDSSSWGNYSGSPNDTGTDSNYEANNIYDLAGNYADWTQEAYAEDFRVSRGGGYDDSGNYAPAFDCDGDSTPGIVQATSSRAVLCML